MAVDLGIDRDTDLIGSWGHLISSWKETIPHDRLASTIADILINYDRTNIKRTRDVEPLPSGKRRVRRWIQLVCRHEGAETNPQCKFWSSGGKASWEDSCQNCQHPVVQREKFCWTAFPASPHTSGASRRAIYQPSLVSKPQLKKWTSGARRLPFNRARTAIKSLHARGIISASQYESEIAEIEAIARFQATLRIVRAKLVEAWQKIEKKDHLLVATWSKDFFNCEIRECAYQYGDSLAPENEYPDKGVPFNSLLSLIQGRESVLDMRIQSKRVLIETRITAFPLQTDVKTFPDLEQCTERFAIRLFIRGSCGHPFSAANLLQLASNFAVVDRT